MFKLLAANMFSSCCVIVVFVSVYYYLMCTMEHIFKENSTSYACMPPLNTPKNIFI